MMRIEKYRRCVSLILVMLCADINVAQDSQKQCNVTDRYRVRCIGLFYNLVSCGPDTTDAHKSRMDEGKACLLPIHALLSCLGSGKNAN